MCQVYNSRITFCVLGNRQMVQRREDEILSPVQPLKIVILVHVTGWRPTSCHGTSKGVENQEMKVRDNFGCKVREEERSNGRRRKQNKNQLKQHVENPSTGNKKLSKQLKEASALFFAAAGSQPKLRDTILICQSRELGVSRTGGLELERARGSIFKLT